MPLCPWMIAADEYWTCLRAITGQAGFGECDTWGGACLGTNDPGEIRNAMAVSGVGVNSTGNRTLRAVGNYESRDAKGRWYYPRAGGAAQAWRMPRKAKYGIAQCFVPEGPASLDDATRELWQRDTCDCTPVNCGTLNGRPDFAYPTCYAYVNELWENYHVIECMGAPSPEDSPQLIDLASNYLHRNVVVHLDHNWEFGACCTPNLGALCYGSDSILRNAGINGGYYNNLHAYWNYLRVRGLSASLRTPEAGGYLPGSAATEIAAKNAALAWLAANYAHPNYGLAALDSRRVSAGDQNAYLDRWEKSWNWDTEEAPTILYCPVVSSSLYPGSQLRKRGIPVSVALCVLAVRIRVALTLDVVDDNPYWPPTGYSPYGYPELPDPDVALQHQVYPIARCEIELKLGTLCGWSTAGGVPGPILPSPWPFDAERFTRVAGHADDILYIDGDGHPAMPPNRVLWRGHLGWKSNPPTEKLLDLSDLGSIATPELRCNGVLPYLYSIAIPAYHTYQDSRAADGSAQQSAQTYGGSINVGFNPPP